MDLTEEQLEIKKKKKELTERKIREMSDESAYCPTCNKTGFESIRTMIYHHNQSHMFSVDRTKQCEHCGEIFSPKNTQNPNKYCSECCFGLAQREETEYITFECQREGCNKARKMYKNKYEKIGGKYCSTACSNKGRESFSYGGESSNVRNTSEYYRWKKKLHDLYNKCQECFSKENLQTHHIIPVSENEELATDLENGTLLCGMCHSKKHPDVANGLFYDE